MDKEETCFVAGAFYRFSQAWKIRTGGMRKMILNIILTVSYPE